MKRTVLVHHHIFKNAGTSFNYALKQYYSDRFLEYDLPSGAVVTPEKLREFILAHPNCWAISGHHIAFPTPQDDEFQTLSTVLLRNPLARIRSIYEFERKQQAETDGAVMAKRLGFREFVLWRLENNPIVLCNYQTYYCARGSLSDEQINVDENTLAVALEHLSKSFIVGTVERYHESIMITQLKLRQKDPETNLVIAHLNTTIKII